MIETPNTQTRKRSVALSLLVALAITASTFVPVSTLVPDKVTDSASSAVPEVVADLFTPATAEAHQDQSPAVGGGVWHPWTSDGCSNVPNWQWGVFNFTHACQHHDGCYRNHWASRYTCDRWFLSDMRASCNTGHTWWFNRNLCRNIGLTYYFGVRALGATAYYGRHYNAPLA